MRTCLGRRRVLLIGLGVSLAAAVTGHEGHGQAPPSRPLVVSLRASPLLPELKAALLQGLRDLGLEDGRDFDLVILSTDNDPTRSPALVAELIPLNPAVVITQTTQLAVEMARASKTIPIVSSTLTDPIEIGLAQSIAHPGGNVTGVMSISASGSKLVEVLREIVPGASRIGQLINPSNIGNVRGVTNLKNELAGQPITLIVAEARVAADIPAAFQVLQESNTQALIVAQDALFNQEIKKVADLALAAKLAAIYGFRNLPDNGGLMSYGTSIADHQHRAGVMAAKILRGEKPADLPIEQNAKVELVVNIKTAKALGLTVPPIILARADAIIE
jgi:putative ABC transport system substrate-binding protein